MYLKRFLGLFLLTAVFCTVLASCGVSIDASSGIIAGEDGWLFEAESVAGYAGENLFTEDELKQILETVKAKRTFFAKTNTDFVLVIAPDKMTVYSDKLPEELQAKKGTQTRLQQVLEYISSNTRITTADATEMFLLNKDAFDLYDKTGTGLSEMGAYIAYTEIIKAVNVLNIASLKTEPLEAFSVETANDDGLELAQRAGVEARLKNNTISVTYTGEAPYHTLELAYTASGATATELNEEALQSEYRYPQLMLYSALNADKLQPFLSLSFRRIAYQTDYVTDANVVSEIGANHAVFFLMESELDTLLTNESVAALPSGNETTETTTETTSEATLQIGGQLHITDDKVATPVITGMAVAYNNRLALCGVTEPDTTLFVNDGREEVELYCDDGIFILDLNKTKEIVLYAVSENGKSASDELIVPVPNSLHQNGEVILGKDSHIHYAATLADYLGTNRYTDNILARKKTQFEKQLAEIKKVSPNTKLIYLIAPNHSTIYPESMPDYLQAQRTSETSRLSLLTEKMADSEVMFVNPTEYLLSKKEESEYILYNKTDTHWNELGAYYAYEYLMTNYIVPDFPAAEPIPLTEFDVFTKVVPGGDMLNYLATNLDLTQETGVFVRPSTFKPVMTYDKPYRMNFENIWFDQTRQFKKDNDELPTLLMYRDSFSTNLMMFMAENFSESYFNGMWGYSYDINLVKQLQPDYLIIELVERNLDSVG